MLEGMGVEGMQGEGSLDILPREENVGERAGLARLALLGEREADLGEEALDRRRRGRAAQVLPRHGGEVGEDVLVLLSPLQSAHHARPCSRSEVVGDTAYSISSFWYVSSGDCC